MKIDECHTKFESIHKVHDEDWNDSNYFESIQHKSERFYDTIQTILNRFRSDKIQNFMKRITLSQRLLVIRFKQHWIDSNVQKPNFGKQKWGFLWYKLYRTQKNHRT